MYVNVICHLDSYVNDWHHWEAQLLINYQWFCFPLNRWLRNYRQNFNHANVDILLLQVNCVLLYCLKQCCLYQAITIYVLLCKSKNVRKSQEKVIFSRDSCSLNLIKFKLLLKREILKKGGSNRQLNIVLG